MPKSTAKRTRPRGVRKRLRRLKKHPFILPVTIFMVLFFMSVSAFIAFNGTTVGASDSRVVELTIDGQAQVLPTRADTVGDLLNRLDVKLEKADIVQPRLDTPIEEDNFQITVYKARPVLIVDGDKRLVTYTAEPTPEGVATAAGLEVFPEDKVSKAPVDTVDAEAVLKEGVVAEKVIIDRATPANLNLYGTPVSIRTHAGTVGELLEEKNIRLNEGDTLRPAADTPLTAGLEVFVTRVGKDIAQIEEAIAPPIEYVDDYNLTLGSSAVQDPGRPGTKLVTYEIEQQNGVETGRRIIQEIVVEQPVRKIVARGRKAPVVAGNKAEIMAAAGISPNEFYAADFIISHESGWRVNALNSRGCGGLGQACPSTKLASACPNWQSDPICQMRYFSGYARGRYGSWSRAYEVWQIQRWW